MRRVREGGRKEEGEREGGRKGEGEKEGGRDVRSECIYTCGEERQ